MTIVNNPSVATPIPLPTTCDLNARPGAETNVISATVAQLTTFIQDHFIEGGKLGVTMATLLSRLPQGFAQESTVALQARLPEIQRRVAELPTAMRAVVIHGGDVETRNYLRGQLAELSQDASLAARTGALWGVAGLAIAAMPLTLTAGYTLGAALGQTRANQLISQAMDTDGAMEAQLAMVHPE